MIASRVIVVSLVALVLVPKAAYAHRLDVEATIRETDPTMIRVEAGYEEIEPAADAQVTLTDTHGVTVVEGRTDETGVCRLPRPAAGTYTVVVDSGDGHRAKVILTVPDADIQTAAARTSPPNRWLMTAAGLALIAAITVAARWLLRKPTSPASNTES